MSGKKYTEDGYLVVSEMHKCPLWETDDRPFSFGKSRDCFFCRYSDFRTPEFIRRVEGEPKKDEWYSVCHNEKNKKPDEAEIKKISKKGH